MIKFKKLEIEDLEKTEDIVNSGKLRLKTLGISQWQKGYPKREDWISGINKREAFKAEFNGVIAGVFCITTEPEDTYENIDGNWLTGNNQNYITIHRICVADEYLKMGVCTEILNYSFEVGKNKGYKSIRIDTHPLNIPMKKLLLKEGFAECGDLFLTYGPEKGDSRKGYEKII